MSTDRTSLKAELQSLDNELYTLNDEYGRELSRTSRDQSQELAKDLLNRCERFLTQLRNLLANRTDILPDSKLHTVRVISMCKISAWMSRHKSSRANGYYDDHQGITARRIVLECQYKTTGCIGDSIS